MRKQYSITKKHNNRIIRNRPLVSSPFSNNLATNMNFGGKDHDLSGYVKREIVMVDAQGNKQMAREIQFFNSWKKLGLVSINESNRSKYRK